MPTDAQIKNKLESVLQPFYAAHMSKPSKVALAVTVDPTEIWGELTLHADDEAGLTAADKEAFTKSFNTLARSTDTDPNRRALGLWYSIAS
jgi:hypothetical protein